MEQEEPKYTIQRELATQVYDSATLISPCAGPMIRIQQLIGGGFYAATWLEQLMLLHSIGGGHASTLLENLAKEPETIMRLLEG